MLRCQFKNKNEINGEELENVNKFEYLGSMLYNNDNVIKEIKIRLNMTLQKLKQMTNIWQGTDRKTILKPLRACIFPISYCNLWLRGTDNLSDSCQVDDTA